MILLQLTYECVHNLSSETRAMAYINTIDVSSCPDILEPTILYAKYTICAKNDDWINADSHFRDLLSREIKFEMALDCLQNYINSSAGRREEVVLSFLKIVSAKFPNDPEFSSLR